MNVIEIQWIVILVLLVASWIQKLIHINELKDFRKANKDLLNRLMARDFPEYIQGDYAQKKQPDAPVGEKERLKAEELETGYNRDIISVTGE